MVIAARAAAVLVALLAASSIEAAALRAGTPSVTQARRLAQVRAITRAPVDPGSATELALAMDVPQADLVSASILGSDPLGVGVGTTKIGRFMPRQGSTFAILSTGQATSATLPNDAPDTSDELSGSLNSQGNDLVQLQLVLQPPVGATCLSFDFAFYSEEFPEFVGSQFNDFFIAELGSSTFTINDETDAVVAPNNFAFDIAGRVISINTVFGVNADTQTTYDGATPLLRAVAVLGDTGGGPVTIILSISDLGDSIYDSAVFLDKFAWVFDPNCKSGAQLAQGIVSPGTFFITQDQNFDVVVFEAKPVIVRSGLVNGIDVSGVLNQCIRGTRLDGGGFTLRCPGLGGGQLARALGIDPFLFDLNLVFNDGSTTSELTVWQFPDPATPKFTILPTSGLYASTQQFDMVLLFGTSAGFPVGVLAALDGVDISSAVLSCALDHLGTTVTGPSYTFRCPVSGGAFAEGSHVLTVVALFADGSAAENTVTWTIVPVVE
jgi:hypothetical protein